MGLTLATVLSGMPAQAAPPPPSPPWSEVLAVDPATVPVPHAVTAAAAACPPVGVGIRNFAPGSGKTVALTFDDGPGASTAQIMAILRDADVTATFFNIGVNATVRPDLVRAEAQEGFLLGNHTWSHPQLTTLSESAQAQEMDRATAEQISLVGSRPCFFRPPYGSYNSTTLTLAAERGMAAYNWSVDTEDWKARGSGSSFWVNRIITRAQAGGSQSHPVVLMHNQPGAMPATVAALPSIIAFYRARGYTFVDLAGRVAGVDKQVTGDWDGNGTTTPGIVRGSTWYLRNSNTPGPADVVFVYGAPTDRVVTGDWDGNGTTTPGVIRGNVWKLRNSNSAGAQQLEFVYGATTDHAVTGDWDGNRTTTPGVIRGTTWKLRNSNSAGSPQVEFVYGAPITATVARPG